MLTYNTWLLWRPLNGHARIFNGYLSELSASDQPHNFFFRGGDLITALIVRRPGDQDHVLWRRRNAVARMRTGRALVGGGRGGPAGVRR